MSDIKNMSQLREVALEAIEKLMRGEIDTSEAVAITKGCDTVVNTVKSEFDYARLTSQIPHIPFMDSNEIKQNVIEVKPQAKKLETF